MTMRFPAGGTATAPPPARAQRTDPVRTPASPAATGQQRLVSLDAFRGLTIAAMLVVNNPGSWSSIYAPLGHAEWNGWTPTDLIFPFFLFIVGVSMTFSFTAAMEKGATRGGLLAKSVKRAAILFGLGLLLHGFPRYDLSSLRIPGVLQRIAIAFLAASIVYLFARTHARIAITAALLLGYWALLTLVPVPGSGAGVLEPGRDLGAFVDRAVFGTSHLWAASRTWDPEGLLSTLPAIATTITGILAGEWIRSDRQPIEKTAGMLIAGNVALAVGLAWGAVFPINKSLWTSSYVVFTSGMALIVLALCYWLIDVRGRRRWAAPFVAFGMNAIAAFFLSGLLARIMGLVHVGAGEGAPTLKGWIYSNVFASWAAPINASLAFALAFTGFWLGIMVVLHRRRIHIRV
jgi:predicted acyltransferase